MKRVVLLSFLLLASCSKKSGDAGTGSGSDTTAAGSATTGSGSSTGSGSATPAAGSGSGSATPAAGSGSATGSGSGSAAAGSGSGSDAGSAGSAAAGSGSGSGSGSATAAKSAWDDLDHDAKMDIMKKKVVPAMREAFAHFDAKKYPKVGCKTCHGKDPEGVKYKMPNPELPKLDFAAIKAGKQKPEISKFMAEVVKPQMAKILGEEEYSESNPKGFGCLECHEMKK